MNRPGFFLMALTAVCAIIAAGQTAQITGRITDPTGAVIPEADVAARNTDTGLKYATRSNDVGYYTLALLPPGSYEVSVHKAGFRPVVRTGVRLDVDQVARLNFTLEVGQITETVEVVSQAPILDTERPTVTATVDRARIEALPLNGRNPIQLMRLAPNVNFLESLTPSTTLDTAGFIQNSMSISGGQSGATAFFLDGGSLNTLQENNVPVTPNVDMVEEFKISTSLHSAEFGMTGGGVINVITRSGTNRWSGAAYDYLRNNALDANSWTNKRVNVPKSVLRYNQFGFSSGGPLVIRRLYDGRSRTFFFGNYEGIRWRSSQTTQARVATEAEKQGDFASTYIRNPQTGQFIPVSLFDPTTTRPNPAGSGYVRDPLPGNRIPASRMDPVAVRSLAFAPAPNRPPDDLTGSNNLISISSVPTDLNQFMVRLDHQLGASNRIFGRYLETRRTSTSVIPTFSADNPMDPTAAFSISRNRQFVLGDTHTFSPTVLNEFRFSTTREFLLSKPSGYGKNVAQLIGLPPGHPTEIAPRFSIADAGYLGGDPSKLALRAQVTGGIFDTVTKVHGRHTLKVGADLRVVLDNNFQPGAIAGTFSFTRALSGDPQAPTLTGFGPATFLLGAVSSGSLNVGIAKSDGYRYAAFFVQDDVKLTARLTMNLGLRYDYIGAPTERFDRYANFNPYAVNPLTGLPGVVEFAGKDFGRSIFEADRNDFGPRIGFAYDVAGSGRLVVRGGYGVYYYQPGGTLILGPYMGFTSTSSYVAQGPFAAFWLKNGVPFIDQPKGRSGGARTQLGSSVSSYETWSRTPYVQQWNFSLQFGLPWQNVFEAAYTGNHGVKLPAWNWDVNQMDPQYLKLGFALQEAVPNPFEALGIFGKTITRSQALRPFPAYLTISNGAPRYGNSNYHSLVLRWEKRFAHGISYLASFTTGKTIGDVGRRFSSWLSSGLDTSGGQNGRFDRRSWRAIEPMDVSKRLVASLVYELPLGAGKRWLRSGVLSGILGGWQINGIFEARTGTPLVVRGANNNAADRPNYLRSAKLPASQRNEYRWFDTAAFGAPPLFTFGNAPNTLPDVRGPGASWLDLSLFRNIALRERWRLQFRAEAFNALNSVNLGLPTTSALSGAFGRITTARDPRIVQLGLRMSW